MNNQKLVNSNIKRFRDLQCFLDGVSVVPFWFYTQYIQKMRRLSDKKIAITSVFLMLSS